MDAVPSDILESTGCDYFVQNMSFKGRGILDPRTGERYQRYQRRYDHFLAMTVPVRQWQALTEPKPEATFCGSHIALRAKRPALTDASELSVFLPQPLVVDQSKRLTYYNSGTGLGSAEAITRVLCRLGQMVKR